MLQRGDRDEAHNGDNRDGWPISPAAAASAAPTSSSHAKAATGPIPCFRADLIDQLPDGLPAARHRSEQYRTISQSRAHFFRQAEGRWQAAQSCWGKVSFLWSTAAQPVGRRMGPRRTLR